MSNNTPQSVLKGLVRLSGDRREGDTIALAAGNCLESFYDCLEIAENLGPKEFALLQNQLGRFSLWTSNLGVFALGRASIDYRLRDIPDTHRLVKGLVEVLRANVQKCIPTSRAWVNLEETSAEDRNHEIERIRTDFGETIIQAANDISLLYQLSNTIRRAGRESQNSKANSFFEIKDADGNNIEKVLEKRFLHNLTDMFPGCDEKLRQRLSSTMLQRRKRILYRRSRRPETSPTQLQIVHEPYTRPSRGGERNSVPVKFQEQETSQVEPYHSEARTRKTTTTLDLEKLKSPTAPTVLSVAKTVPLTANENLVFPAPPRAAVIEQFRELKSVRRAQHQARLLALPNFQLYNDHDGKPPSLSAEETSNLQLQIQESERILQTAINSDLKLCRNTETEVLCPYCLCALSSKDLKSDIKWREHLRGDLDAYVCLFQDCHDPNELYSHSDAWLKHMRQHAVRWQCPAKSHGPQVFERREIYECHLREAHGGVFSENQISAMGERNARMMGPLFQSCPLCGVSKGHATVMGRLEDHVVGHLRYLALNSLPYVEEEDINTNTTRSLKSDDSAKPTDRSTARDIMEQEYDIIFKDENITTRPPPVPPEDEVLYAAWGGVENYVRATHVLRPGEPPEQTIKFQSRIFPCPDIPDSNSIEEVYVQQLERNESQVPKIPFLGHDENNESQIPDIPQSRNNEELYIQQHMQVDSSILGLPKPTSDEEPQVEQNDDESSSAVSTGQELFDQRDLEARIEDCLTGNISNALRRCERHSGRIGPDQKSFFCRSDLEQIWNSESRLIDIVFGHLSEGQRHTLVTDLLLFISFLAKIEVRPRFIVSCRDAFFVEPESPTPKFKDDDGTKSQAELLEMGLTPRQSSSWKEQYLFRPAKITFATEKWAPQRIDPRIPLPFELIDDVHSGVMIHRGFGFGDDTGYNSQYGTVGLYRIPREYVENDIRAQETWKPTEPLLRIVKSFAARQLVIEEAKNMELLKQSLVTNVNISIHDAIIEQRQEDDAGIVSIVSPYATLGDLAQFLAGGYENGGHGDKIYDMAEKFPLATDTHQLRLSLLAQSKNLASALEFLHNGFTTKANDWKIKCAHLDLKPSNILIFESSQRDEVVGTWKLSDFGISVFGAEHLQGSPKVQLGSAGDYFMKFADTIRTAPKRIPGVYQAPEIEHPHSTSDDSNSPEHGARTSDIWSFGAIFTEVLAYAHDGARGVKRFDGRRRRRTTISGRLAVNDFFYTNTEEHTRRSSSTLPCVVRPEVSLWLEEFSSGDEAEPLASGVCLRCWAECVKNILEVDPHARPSAPTLSQWIADLHRHAKENKPQHVHFEHLGSGRTRPKTPDEEPENPEINPTTTEPPIFLDRARKSHRFVLELSSPDVIDYDLDGSKLMYLTKKGFDIFLVNKPESCVETKPLQSDHMWRGIKVAEPYVVVWGSRISHGRESALCVYNLNTSSGPLPRTQPAVRNIHFIVNRRVAVSRQGLIAVINNEEILVLDANDSALKELSKITMVWQDPVGKFVDVAFDHSGSLLYAWGNQYTYGVLFAYKFEKRGHGVGEEVFRGKFKNAFSEHKAIVLPFDKQRECAVAVGPTPTSFFLGNVDQPRRDSSSTSRKDSSLAGSDRFNPQKYSDHLPGYYAWAGCTIHDSMLLLGATKSGLFAHRKVEISEQIIGTEGRLRFPSMSTINPSIETKTPWSPRHNPELNTEVKLGVVPSDEAVDGHSIVVYYKKGFVEILS